MNQWMTWISKLRWAILVGWIVIASLSFFLLPDLQTVVRNTEQKFLPANAESVQATRLLQQINPASRSFSNAVIVLSRKGGLRDADKSWMSDFLAQLESRKEELHITSLLTAQTQPELAERLLSKDGSTMLAIVNLPTTDFQDETRTTLDQLKQLLKSSPVGTMAALTGGAALSQDFQQSSQNGLHRTEILTIGIVLVILLFVFRSPVTPLIPLVTIGISFVISRGLIGAATAIGVPVSHFTESFLIAVLFGAGTDYCILMIQRYREEFLSGGDGNALAAMSRMMNGIGKTIIYSASTVFIAFLIIGLAEFGLYRSAIGVAIGMVVTVFASMTLAPALLLIFGKAIFWPLRQASSNGHDDSRIWGNLASLASKRSVMVLLSAVIFLAPLTLLFHGKRSFDDISEMSPALASVIGFRQVEKAFSQGEVFPVTMAITSKQSMRTPTGLAALEQASSELTRVQGVREVRSAVRPLGHKPEELTVPGQLKSPDVNSIIKSLLEQQQSLLEGLKALALGAAPLSQGYIGIWPAIRQLEGALSELLASQLDGMKRVSKPEKKTEEQAIAERAAAKRKQQALDYYISPDGLTTKFELILEPNPYSSDALNAVQGITQELRESLNATALESPEAFATGISAKYNELRDISYRDFVKTGLLVLAGIAIVLVVLLRSIAAPLYVLISLGFNYLITMGLLEFLFVKILGFPGLSWTVSFFIFLIIVALGVDYSIFLMARFKEEYRPGEAVMAMDKAMRTTGGIIGSAAVIMAGTFGALSFSGVDTLVQIGVGTLIGLLLYAALFMALIVPAFAFLLGEANWWPFRKKKAD
ncbi:MMPL family transporter [Cohnella silvisoli]|uniref:MMPL family transporter n=1 Tax=Cohnella silvisoli TaxID=2873699 RepID=A0ABV1KXL8_9BACL|nr:MMPL family transporter [Cohnella silvisoli]MCD9024175.1 MMPL family transporter [Cohnella silvisoli]